MEYEYVIEKKKIQRRCENCLYCGSNGVTCAHAGNQGRLMILVNGGKACRHYWLNQNRYTRAN